MNKGTTTSTMVPPPMGTANMAPSMSGGRRRRGRRGSRKAYGTRRGRRGLMYGGQAANTMSVPPATTMPATTVPASNASVAAALAAMRPTTVPATAATTSSTLSVPMAGGKRRTRKVAHKKGGYHRMVGTKAQVWHGSAHHTSGGLTKKQLMKHKGRIVSRKKHELGKKAFKRLVKAGYKPKKGTFKLFRK